MASVTRRQVQASNSRIVAPSYPQTAVFVGGTSGIGKAVIQELAHRGAKEELPCRIYVIGRQSAAERTIKSLGELRTQNPNVELIWTPGDVSLLAEVKRICNDLKEKEISLDLLFLSAGYSPFGGREETTEGLITAQVLGYYSRILFILHLLPLLKESPLPHQGRIISILGAGMESSSIDLTNLDLSRPGSFNGYKSQMHTITMLTMTMEKLAESEENADVTFIHAYPGLVKTGNLNRGWGDRWVLQGIANIVLAPVFATWAMGIQESAERIVFLMTSARFGGCGVEQSGEGEKVVTTRGEEKGGLFLVGYKCGTVKNEKVLEVLRREAQGKIWEWTMGNLGRHL